MPRKQTAPKKSTQAHADVDEFDISDLADATPNEEVTIEEVATEEVANAMGVGLSEDTKTPIEEKNAIKYISSIVNEFVYFFPVTETRSFSEAIQLGTQMHLSNLKVGQVFCMNPSRNTPFLFIPSCGISLSFDTPTWTYRGLMSDTQKADIINHIQIGDLVLGEQGIVKVNRHLGKPKLDVVATLADLSKLRALVTELVNSDTVVAPDGEITSPGIEIKALSDYEVMHQNRKNVMELLTRASKQVHGTVAFVEGQVAEDELANKEAEAFAKESYAAARGSSNDFSTGATVGDYL